MIVFFFLLASFSKISRRISVFFDGDTLYVGTSHHHGLNQFYIGQQEGVYRTLLYEYLNDIFYTKKGLHTNLAGLA